MSVSSLLLRVLLSVCLIANGAGIAQASVRMQLAHQAGHEGMQDPTAEGSCHAEASAQVSVDGSTRAVAAGAHSGHDMRDAVEADAGVGDMTSSDCCSASICTCACAQHVQVAFVPAAWGLAGDVHAPLVVAGRSQHSDPRLPHRIRPPIG